MADEVRKKVDESWKERVEHEKQEPPAAGAPSGIQAPPAAGASKPAEEQEHPAVGGTPPTAEHVGGGEHGVPEARFDLFVSGLAVEALVAMGDMPHPATRRQAVDLTHARYMIDLLGIFEEKTKGNLSVDEDRLLKDTLYQLRMRYLNKTGGV